MQYRSVKGFSGGAQTGILFAFLGAGLIVSVIVQAIITFMMIPPGTSLNNMEEAVLKAMLLPENVTYARMAQVLGTFFLFFVPAVAYSWLTNGRNKFWLGFNRYINGYQLLIGFLLIYAATVFASPLDEISRSMVAHFPKLDRLAIELENKYNEQVVALSHLRSWPEFIMAIVIMAFFPALFEELFFRGALQNVLTRWWKAPLLAIIFTSLLFSLIHFSIYLFLSRAVLGIVLGLMYHQTKNIWINVVAHFLNNAIAVAQLFWLSMNNKKVDPEQLAPDMEWWGVALGLVFLIALFILLDKLSRQNRIKIDEQEKLLVSRAVSNSPFSQTEI